VFDNRKTFLTPLLGAVERALYRLAGVDPEVEQKWVALAVGDYAVHWHAVSVDTHHTRGTFQFNREPVTAERGGAAPDESRNVGQSESSLNRISRPLCVNLTPSPSRPAETQGARLERAAFG
jgi:hypothetical protein